MLEGAGASGRCPVSWIHRDGVAHSEWLHRRLPQGNPGHRLSADPREGSPQLFRPYCVHGPWATDSTANPQVRLGPPEGETGPEAQGRGQLSPDFLP